MELCRRFLKNRVFKLDLHRSARINNNVKSTERPLKDLLRQAATHHFSTQLFSVSANVLSHLAPHQSVEHFVVARGEQRLDEEPFRPVNYVVVDNAVALGVELFNSEALLRCRRRRDSIVSEACHDQTL